MQASTKALSRFAPSARLPNPATFGSNFRLFVPFCDTGVGARRSMGDSFWAVSGLTLANYIETRPTHWSSAKRFKRLCPRRKFRLGTVIGRGHVLGATYLTGDECFERVNQSQSETPIIAWAMSVNAIEQAGSKGVCIAYMKEAVDANGHPTPSPDTLAPRDFDDPTFVREGENSTEGRVRLAIQLETRQCVL
jgi:hypothetical protein